MRILLTPKDVEEGLSTIAGSLCEQHQDLDQLLLVGVRRGGLAPMRLIAEKILALTGKTVATGTVDITWYRDDSATALPNARLGPSDMPHQVDGTQVVLIDDVLYTRRTIRAAIDAVFEYGRPANIELAVVVDRAGRQLPIQPDYAVRRFEDLRSDERVDVFQTPEGLQAIVQPYGAPSIPPAT